ncbi:MAG: FapA family protein [Desulfobacteraceae bacterium]|nr:FapA family protein [Desulfobacteraceae bacterium]
MSDVEQIDKLFGEIAIEKQIVTKDKLERALVIQRCINNRTQVFMPIGAVLQKMGVLTKEQVDSILAVQAGGAAPQPVAGALDGWTDAVPLASGTGKQVRLEVAPDKLSATIAPTQDLQPPPSMEKIKALLLENNISYGVISDKLLSAYLAQNPMPMDPFVVARGVEPVPGKPPEIQYFFDTNPMRIGTLLEDGTMDWKNRGEIPQVAADTLLAEKVGGDPGKPGTDVFGQEIPVPRIKDPSLKFSKGVTRSEDGRQLIAKIGGTPRLGPDGRVTVWAVLPIDSNVGIETGNVIFEGHVEVNGGIESGYMVKAGSLETREIQSATIDISGDMAVHTGIYSTTGKVGGHLKASHIHNSTLEVLGDLVVEKEIFGCTIEINGRCLVDSGKIISSKISAKKGIQVKDIGTSAAKPSELTVGVDYKYEREMKACKDALADQERKKTETETTVTNLKKRIDELDAELGQVAQEQDGCMVQKRQLEERLKEPAIAKNKEKISLLQELISDLGAKYELLDKKVQAIMAQDDQVRAQIAHYTQEAANFDKQIAEIKEKIQILEESAKIDPGNPVIKASGTVFAKTLVICPHRRLLIPNETKNVRISEILEDGKQYSIKIA